MSQDSKDERAATKQFLEDFKNIGSEQEQKLWPVFMKFYKQGYRKAKQAFSKVDAMRNPLEKQGQWLIETTTYTGNAYKFLVGYESQTPERQARRLGMILGMLLATIDYGLVSKTGTDALMIEKHERQVLQRFEQVASHFIAVEHEKKQKFISHRIIKIAKAKGNTIRPKTKKVLAAIAAMFLYRDNVRRQANAA